MGRRLPWVLDVLLGALLHTWVLQLVWMLRVRGHHGCSGLLTARRPLGGGGGGCVWEGEWREGLVVVCISVAGGGIGTILVVRYCGGRQSE